MVHELILRRKHSSLTYARRILGAVMRHPANEGRVLSALVRACFWQVYKRTVRLPLTVTIGPAGALIRLHPDSSSCGNVVYFTWKFDYWESEFLVRYLRQCDNVVDMGANVGFFTILAASLVGPDGEVVAIEPFPMNAARIREAIDLNGFTCARVEQCALGEQAGIVDFISDMDVSNRIATSADSPQARRITVELKRPDAILANDKTWAFWKIDVEGAEAFALRGASGIFDINPPVVIQLELIDHLMKAQGSSLAEVTGFMTQRGYGGFIFSPRTGELERVELSDVRGNVLLIREESLAFVAARLRREGRDAVARL